MELALACVDLLVRPLSAAVSSPLPRRLAEILGAISATFVTRFFVQLGKPTRDREPEREDEREVRHRRRRRRRRRPARADLQSTRLADTAAADREQRRPGGRDRLDSHRAGYARAEVAPARSISPMKPRSGLGTAVSPPNCV